MLCSGVGILDNQVAGVTGVTHIRESPLGSRTDLDHIEDILEMVINRPAAGSVQ